MEQLEPYRTPKHTLYVICPAIIKSLRIPEASDGTAGRRTGEPNLDEISGANDIVYHLMCNETIAIMAKELGVAPDKVLAALHVGLNSIEKGT
jgi:hypothetical protein